MIQSSGPDPLVQSVYSAIQQHHLFVPGQKAVVGVSGGPDSLCLLHALRELAPSLSLDLYVGHVNHSIRGQESDQDAAFVVELARQWNLPVWAEKVDVPTMARAHNLATEEAARCARYAFLARLARQVGASTIVVAHNADDQVETVIMHWLRGAGLAGLRGMLPVTPLSEYRLVQDWETWITSSQLAVSEAPPTFSQPLLIVRPLLEIARQEIEDYCVRCDLQPRLDRTNLDTTYYRNRLRHELLPYLETYNVNIRHVLRRSANVIAADYDLLRSQLETTWPEVVRSESPGGIVFDLQGWRALPLSLKRSTLRQAIHRLRHALRNIDFVHVEKALKIAESGSTGALATLPQGLVLRVEYDTFCVAAEGQALLPDLPFLMSSRALAVKTPGTTQLPDSGWILTARWYDLSSAPRASSTHPERETTGSENLTGDGLTGPSPVDLPEDWSARLDSRVVGRSPVLRTRLPGDHFCPLGMQGHSKRVNEFMINEKIPAAWRQYVPLLVNERGQIVWVCGWRPDHRARVTHSTRTVVEFRFERN